MSEGWNIAVLGATGAVGEALLETLAERQFPVGEIYALARNESAGEQLRFGGKTITVQDAAEFDWTQAQLELFCAEHPDMLPETADFLSLLQEQTERLSQMTKTLLEMSNLQQVERNESIQLAPMVEEIFTDLTPLAEKSGITLELAGDGVMTGSDALIYRMIFNLTENAIKYNRPDGSVQVCITQEPEKLLILVSDTGRGIPEEYQQSIFQPFFRVDKSRSRTFGGAGLGLALVWEIAALHGGSVRVAESSDSGTTIAAELPRSGNHETDPKNETL